MRYKKHVEVNGWSEWIVPKPEYKMACCDCGLVHNIQFRVVKQLKDNPDGTFNVRDVPCDDKEGNHRVFFRANRNVRATAAMRRERKKKAAKK